MTIDATSLLCIVGSVLSFLSGAVLITFNENNSLHRRLLGAYFFLICYMMLIILLISSGTIVTFPHLFRTGVLAAYLFQPLAYLYVRQYVKPGLSARDLVHLLPGLLYFIDFIPFFLLPAPEKQAVIISVTGTHINALFAHREGWLTPPWFHLAFRVVLSLLYCILSARLVWKMANVRQPEFYHDNAAVIKWLWTFVIAQFLIFSPYVIVAAIGRPQYSFYTTVVPFTLMATATCVALFFKPSIFYGFSGMLVAGDAVMRGHKNANSTSIENNVSGNGHDAMRRSEHKLEYVSEAEVAMIRQTITSFLRGNKSYLQPGYSIADLSRDVGVSMRKISAYVNQVEQLNFREFLNRFRIEHCIENLTKDTWQHLTLEAIAEQCGFNNRNSFTTAFKKFSGSNPSTYLSMLKRGK